MHANDLVYYVDNDRRAHDAVMFAVRYLRTTLDQAARRRAKENQDWHDDPEAKDHAAFQAPADKQFTRATRDKAARALVASYLREMAIQEGNRCNSPS